MTPSVESRSDTIVLENLDEENGRSESPPSQTFQSLQKPSRQYQILLLLSGFLMIFHTIGISQVYGIFQEYYTSPSTHIRDASSQYALVSLVGTIGSGLTWSGGIIVNPLMSRIKNVQLITVPGAIIMSLGLFLASYSTRLWHLYLTQSLMYGVGSSMYYFPIMSITPLYFDQHRGFAMGFVLAGSGVGGLVLAPVTQTLMDKYGAGWTLRTLGIWNLVVGLPIACVVKHRRGFEMAGDGANRARAKTRMNMALVKRGSFIYQSFGAFLQAAGNIVPTYYLTSYSTSVLSYPRSTGSTLLAIFSAVNSVSRVGSGVLADRVGRQNTLIAGVILSGVSVFAFWFAAERARFIVFVVMYGIYSGGYNALLPTTITEVYGVENYTSVNGFIYFIRGLGSMMGAPLAGAILGTFSKVGSAGAVREQLKDRYKEVVIYDGALLLGASVCVLYVRWLDARDKGRWLWKA